MSNDEKSEFDKFIEQLQQQIDEEARRDFSEIVINEAQNPYHYGKIEHPTVQGKYRGWCGDSIQLFLNIDENQLIKEAYFLTDGCAATVACGSMLIKLIENKTIGEVSNLTEDDLKNALNGLPPENDHCATLAVTTLKETIKDYKK